MEQGRREIPGPKTPPEVMDLLAPPPWPITASQAIQIPMDAQWPQSLK